MNSDLTIRRTNNNGFFVTPETRHTVAFECYVFESLDSLLTWLKDQLSKPVVTQEKQP